MLDKGAPSTTAAPKPQAVLLSAIDHLDIVVEQLEAKVRETHSTLNLDIPEIDTEKINKVSSNSLVYARTESINSIAVRIEDMFDFLDRIQKVVDDI